MVRILLCLVLPVPPSPPATTHGVVTTAQMPPRGAKQRLEGRDTWENLLSRVLSTCGSSRFPLPFHVLNSQDENTGLSSHSFSRQENAPSIPSAVLDARNSERNPTRSSTLRPSSRWVDKELGQCGVVEGWRGGSEGIESLGMSESPVLCC